MRSNIFTAQLAPAVRRSSLYLATFLAVLFLSACASVPQPIAKSPEAKKAPALANAVAKPSANAVALPKANSGKGGYYQDDGPGEAIPADLELTQDPVPVVEAYSRTGNKPYVVFGQTYTPINDNVTPFKQRGIASWYGKKFHGKRTSSGEPYDMYKITAAHPLLPIPSYARVTNLSNGKQIIVRINDRGPFHSNRIMDLSYTAALKLDYLGKGSSEVEIERLLPEDIAKMAENRENKIVQTEQGDVERAKSKAKIAEKRSVSLDDLIADQEKKLEKEATQSRALDTRNTTGNYYLQFAAFGIRANAESTLEQLKLRLQDKVQTMNFEIVQQGNLYRLQSGPFADRNAASAAAEQLVLAGTKPIVVQR
jgi:rare lipoprotein A